MAKISRSDKEQIVSKLSEKLSSASAYILANYHGLTVSQLQELKNSLKEAKAEFNVLKNTLFRLATKKTANKSVENFLEGPTAILFAFEDPIEAIKKLVDFIKKYELPKIKVGIIDNKVLEEAQIIQLAKIPGRMQLYANVAGSLNSPLSGLMTVLNGNIKNLVYALGQIKQKKAD